MYIEVTREKDYFGCVDKGEDVYRNVLKRYPLDNIRQRSDAILDALSLGLLIEDGKFVGSIKTSLFGGEGLFFARITGPGKVYLQSLPFSRLVDRIKRGISFSQTGGETRGAAGIGGDILKGIISGG